MSGSHFRLEPVVQGLQHPWGLAFLSADTILVSERPGRLRLVRDGRLLSEEVSGLPEPLVYGQGGYLDVIADPGFVETGRIYLSYAGGTRQKNRTIVISARLSRNFRKAEDVKRLFHTDFLKSGGAHFGSRFAFLPDGSLVFGLGDGFFWRQEAQKLQNHLGTSIRLYPDGSVPPDNPFADNQHAQPEIYSYGHRNMQGIAYDSVSGQLYGTEHGPKGGDELNLLQPGANYGWPLASFGVNYSGTPVSDKVHVEGSMSPILYWTPSIAVSGLSVYHGQVFPEFEGDLLISSLKAGDIRRVRVREGVVIAQEVLIRTERRLRHVAVSPYDGHVYVLTDDGHDGLYRLIRE